MRRSFLTCLAATLVLGANIAYAQLSKPTHFMACPNTCVSTCPGGCTCLGHIFNPSKHYCAAEW